jgi:hypothetical protein
MATLLAKKASTEIPLATSDDHHDALAADPAVSQFSQGSSFGTPAAATSTTAFGSASAFGTPASASSSFGSTGAISASSMAPSNSTVLTAAGSNAAQGADVLVENDNTDWINKKWRPVMGWVYMLTCTMDFVVFPILWSLLQALTHGNVTSQWQPLTLQGAGLYHIAMGAVLGIAAYGRTKEKVAGAA